MPKNIPDLVWRIVIGALIIALFAQLEIQLPLNEAELDISGQTYAVVLIGYFLGFKEGTLAVVFYLLTGFIGLPVFSGGTSGLDKLWGNSGGYLMGFLAAVGIIGKYLEGKKEISFLSVFAIFLFATFVILFLGTIRLRMNMGWATSIQHGLTPFITGGIIKSSLAAFTTVVYNRWLVPTFHFSKKP